MHFLPHSCELSKLLVSCATLFRDSLQAPSARILLEHNTCANALESLDHSPHNRQMDISPGIAIAAVEFRLSSPADLGAIMLIEQECFQPPLRFNRGLMRSLLLDQYFHTWVALVRDEMAGFAIVGPEKDAITRTAYLWTIEISARFRRRRLARELLARTEVSALTLGYTAIELNVETSNTSAIALYEGAGYQCLHTDPDFYGLGTHALRYTKTLSLG